MHRKPSSLSFTLTILASFVLCTGASAAELIKNSACLDCHSDKTLSKTNAAGKEVSLFVDEAKLAASVHATNACHSCHSDLTDKPLMEGDVVHLELDPRISGYNARLMRPAVVGAPSQEQSHIAAVLIGAQNRQIAGMRPGALASEVDALGREPILDAGLRDSYDNITGYMLGLYAAATPRTSDFTRTLDPKADWLLESGMVLHVYNSARGMAFSETVLVGSSGPERLTRLERRLFSVPAPVEEEE